MTADIHQGDIVPARTVSLAVLFLSAFCFAVLGIGVALCFGLGIDNHRPADAAITEFVAGKSQFWQEPRERLLFLLFTFCALLSVLVAPQLCKLLTRSRSPVTRLPATWLLFVVCVLVLLLARDTSMGDDAPIKSYMLPTLVWLISPVRWVPYLLGIGLLIVTWRVLESRARTAQSVRWFEATLTLAGWFTALLLAYRLSWIEVPPLLGWTPSIAHEALLAQPVYEVLRGYTVFVDIASQYGGFPHVAALFGAFGLDARSALILAMGIALFVELVLIFELLRDSTGPYWALLGLLAIIWCTPVAFTDFLLFQCLHLRWLFPVLLMFCANGLHRGRTRHGAIAWVSLPCALYWNPETGVACVIAWCTFLTWQVWSKRLSVADALRPARWAALAMLAIGAAYWWRSGHLPDGVNALSYLQVFASAGFGMLPMTVAHWWVIYALLALAALIFARLNPADSASGLLWISGSFCFLLFPYFLGRSVITNLQWISYPAVIIAVIATARGRHLEGAMRSVSVLLLIAAASATVATPFLWPPVVNPSASTRNFGEREQIRAFVQATNKGSSLSTVAFLSPQSYALEEMFSIPARMLPPALSATILKSHAKEWERYALTADDVYLDNAFVPASAQLDHPWSRDFLKKLEQRFVWDAELVVDGRRMFHGARRTSHTAP